MKESFVLGIAGRMGSGKSVLAKELAVKLQCPASSFGDTVREIAESRGLPITRPNLQSIGEGLVENQLAEFCQAVIEKGGDWRKSGQLVIDGFRHLQAVEAVRRLVEPVPLFLVFFDAPEEMREARLREREPDLAQHPEFGKHSTEQSVDELQQAADLVLRGQDLEGSGADAVVRWLNQDWRSTMS